MDDRASRVQPTGRWLLTGAAIVVVLIATVIAMYQEPRMDPFSAPPSFWNWSSDRTRAPRETNAFMRMPMIEPRLSRLFTLPGTTEVWAVGESPVVLHSSDAGRTWKQHDVRRRPDGTM